MQSIFGMSEVLYDALAIIYLNPLSVNITVKQNPLVLVGLVVGHVPVSDTD
jgi:hypothetical protein